MMGLRQQMHGPDVLGPTDLKRAPRAACQELLGIYQRMEEVGSMPWQLMLVIITLLPKPPPAKPGAERAIGLAPWLSRLHCAMRGTLAQGWVKYTAGFWDEAVRGSSALRVALMRAFADERSPQNTSP